MNTKTRKEIFKLKTTKENEYLVGEVYYDKGGMNYFSGNSNPRGYYFSVCPEIITAHTREFKMFSGLKTFLAPANRFSAKVLAETTVSQEVTTRIITRVCEKKNKLLLVEAVAS